MRSSIISSNGRILALIIPHVIHTIFLFQSLCTLARTQTRAKLADGRSERKKCEKSTKQQSLEMFLIFLFW